MKSRIWRNLLYTCLAASCLLLTGCKKLTPPEQYSLGEQLVPSIDTMMTEGQAKMTAMEEPSEEFPDRYIFHYEKVSDMATLYQSYCDQMTSEEYGFTMTDDHYQQIYNPDFTTPTGEVILARPAEQKDKLYRIVLGWSPGEQDEKDKDKEEEVPLTTNCTVEIANVDGTVTETEPPPPPQQGSSSESGPDGAGGSSVQPEGSEASTLVDQIQYFYTLSPELLGLEGESLDQYDIFPLEGILSVDGSPCRQMQVYHTKEPEMTNAISGIYLLTLDLKHVYHLDPFNMVVTKLQ